MSTKTTTTAPTDLELMMYADGELEGERLLAVEAYLAGSVDAQRKVVALDVASSILRDHASEAAKPADDIADLVMAKIAAEPKSAPANVVSIAAKREERAAGAAGAPRAANDGRHLFAIAAVAIAAAAALLLWSRGTTGPSVADNPSAAVTAPAASGEADTGFGVEVAAVDFGALTGALFYVPTGTTASETTTVVWISDDSAGGDE